MRTRDGWVSAVAGDGTVLFEQCTHVDDGFDDEPNDMQVRFSANRFAFGLSLLHAFTLSLHRGGSLARKPTPTGVTVRGTI